MVCAVSSMPAFPSRERVMSEAIYLRDPDGNGIELSWDRPKAEWPLTDDGRLVMDTHPLNTSELLREVTTDEAL